MRILIISDMYPPYYEGGYELRCKETADEISRRGHQVFVLTSWWGLDHTKIEGNIYRILSIDPTRWQPSRSDSFDPFRLRKRFRQLKWAYDCRRNFHITRELISSLKPDVVFIWNMTNLGINPILAAQDMGIPTIYSLGIDWLCSLKKDLYLEPSLLKRKYREAISGIKSYQTLDLRHLITNSEALKQVYVKNGFSDKDIAVIPRGIPSNIVIENVNQVVLPKSNTVRLLFVGRVVSVKAPDDAIKAIAILDGKVGNRYIELDIIGTGQEEYIRELKELITVLNMESHVKFLGWLEHAEILNLYSYYDALIFPSRWEESFGVVIIEAMARGLPVIATNRGGNPEIITDDVNGLLVPADHPDRLAEAIDRLFQEDGLAKRLRTAALNTIHEKFELERIVDRFMLYFQTVLEQN
jgi:glycosyltransferase involved in cell wall biosynthesis